MHPAADDAGRGPTPAAPAVDLDQRIAAVAALRDEGARRDGARHLARAFGPEVVPELARRFNVMVEPPPDFAARDPSACAWIGCWQAALLEILGQYREHALPVLRERGLAGHDTAAVVMLCRLAAAGVDRQPIVADLRGRAADLPPGLLRDVGGALLGLARSDPAVAALVEELRREPAFEHGLAEAREGGDGWAAAPGGGPGGAGGPPGSAAARRGVWAVVALAAGVGVGLGVVGATGAWGAVLVGGLAVGFTAAVLLLAEVTVLRRM
jgi:hypothetical protein